MKETDRGFISGDYHRRHDKLASVVKLLYPRSFTMMYETSLRLAERQGWPNPYKKEKPVILQSGTAGDATSSAFVHFVTKQNPQSEIHILDIAAHPLEKARKRLEKEFGKNDLNVTFHQGDATQTSFPDRSFDLIETDFFIEFFSPEAKAKLFQEWYRLLKSNGIITTRDHIQTRGTRYENFLDQTLFVKRIKQQLGVQSYTTTNQEVSDLMQNAGFETAIIPAKVPHTNIRLPLMKFVIAHKAA